LRNQGTLSRESHQKNDANHKEYSTLFVLTLQRDTHASKNNL
jgi:hypothetical protein